jgi:phospholipase C
MSAEDETWRRERPCPELPPGTDTIPKIRHIVILMMSGHSYDNYLGSMAGRGDGFPLDSSGFPDVYNSLPNGMQVAAHHLPTTTQQLSVPVNSAYASQVQWAEGTCGGFAASIAMTVAGGDPAAAMGYWTADDLPYIERLARTFPVADRWFASCLGPALPNRRFLIAGTGVESDQPANGTIFGLLNRHRISWANYQSNATSRGLILSRLFGRGGLILGRRIRRALLRPLPIPYDLKFIPAKFTADIFTGDISEVLAHVRPLSAFFADAAAGTLPSVSVVDPDFQLNSGENPQDVHASEALTAAVVNSVMVGPGWADTLLIWLHDNGGGYYDHVPPPVAVPPEKGLDASPDGIDYGRLGFRVPAVVVSPYARRNFVSSTVYDHTSVLKLIERKWNLPPLTSRDAAAADPLDMLDLDGAPAFLHPPRGFRIDTSRAFRITSAPRLARSLVSAAVAWGIGLAAFFGSSYLFQTAVLLVLTVLTVQGVVRSRFYRQWIFWRPPKYPGISAVYNALFAFVTLTVFCALVSAELYRYGLFRVAEARPDGNLLWLYTVTYFWNLVDAVPGLQITGTLHWDTPLHFSNIWGELFIILFRLLALGPLLAVLAHAIQEGGKPAKSEAGQSARPFPAETAPVAETEPAAETEPVAGTGAG